MRAIPTTNPRRRPRQARAQATVDAIVKATARVLIEEGYDRASTNRIALAAGVSIGSLYQYFPSKEALVAALVESHVQRMRESLSLSLREDLPVSLQDRARMLVRGMIAAYRVSPQLHHVLCQEVPKVGELTRVYGFEQHLADVCRRHLFSAQEPTGSTDVDRSIFLLVHAVPSVIRAAIQADPQAQSDERLTDDLTDMIVRYLR
ncbi:MAG: TetR/AcrR family transcriptional regulator [Polyangiales bacterium]